ncbi:MAG: choice-of-anchor Q domain-containing protein [Lysobacteraceae bacterium]
MSASFKYLRGSRIGLLLWPLLGFCPVAATTINVTNEFDARYAGRCNLRDAIQAANSNSPVEACPAGQAEPTVDVINVPAGVYYLAGGDNYWSEDANQTGDLDVRGSVIIKGASIRSTVIVAPPRDRAFDLGSAASITLQDMTIVGGNLVDNSAGSIGGTVVVYALGNTSLKNLVLRGGRAQSGGNLYVKTDDARPLQGDNLTLTDGEATFGGGGLFVQDTSSGHGTAPTFRNVTISGNHAPFAAGIYQSGYLNLNQVTVTGNQGGGIHAAGDKSYGLWLANSIVISNPGATYEAELNCASIGAGQLSQGSLYWSMVGSRSPLCMLFETGSPASLDARLSPMFDFGAGVPVHALLPGSAAAGAGKNVTGSAATDCVSKDARGVTRPLTACDLGAFQTHYDFTLNSTADLIDANPGDGGCAAINGACTLRAAVMEASALGGRRMIKVPVGTYTLARPLDGNFNNDELVGDIDIAPKAGTPPLSIALIGQGDADDVQIVGDGTDRVIEANGNGGHYYSDVSSSRPLAFALVNVTVRGGRLSQDQSLAPEYGGQLRGGGLVLRFGRHLLYNVVIQDNSISDAMGNAPRGGGLAVDLRPDVVASAYYGSASSAYVPFTSGLTMERFAVVDNHVLSTPGAVGGMDLWLSNPVNGMPRAFSTIRNGTVSGNSAPFTGGMAIYGDRFALSYLTVADNLATDLGDIGGAYLQSGLIANSIIAGNLNGSGSSDCVADLSFTGLGYVLIGDSSGCGLTGDPVGNQLDVDPLLAPLSVSAEGMPVQRLHADSPALDAIPYEHCLDPASGLSVLTDARAAARPGSDVDQACTMGAVEGSAIPAPEVFSDGFE